MVLYHFHYYKKGEGRDKVAYRSQGLARKNGKATAGKYNYRVISCDDLECHVWPPHTEKTAAAAALAAEVMAAVAEGDGDRAAAKALDAEAQEAEAQEAEAQEAEAQEAEAPDAEAEDAEAEDAEDAEALGVEDADTEATLQPVVSA